MAPVNWCDKCNSQFELKLECLRKRSLCEWCNKDMSPPSMFVTKKKLQKSKTRLISSDGVKKKEDLIVKIQCFDCGFVEIIPLTEFPTFSNGYFIDISIINNLMCRQCFDQPTVTIIPIKKKSANSNFE